jgi:hypothetical protein
MKIFKNTVVVPKDGACFDLICQLLRASTPGRPDRGAETVRRIVRAREGIVFALEWHDRNDRAELLASNDRITFGGSENNRWQHEETLLPRLGIKLSPTRQYGQPFFRALVKETCHELELRSVVERSHGCFSAQAVAYYGWSNDWESFDEFLITRLVDVNPRLRCRPDRPRARWHSSSARWLQIQRSIGQHERWIVSSSMKSFFTVREPSSMMRRPVSVLPVNAMARTRSSVASFSRRRNRNPPQR